MCKGHFKALPNTFRVRIASPRLRDEAPDAYSCWTSGGVFVFLSFFDFVSVLALFGMAGRACSRPRGVDSGPGDAGSEGVRGAP